MFHKLDRVFQPLDPTDTSNQKEVLYLKKM